MDYKDANITGKSDTPTTYTLTEEEMLKIKSDGKDMKDLYDNAINNNRELTKEKGELTAKTLELQELLSESNEDLKNNNEEYRETIADLEKDCEVKDAIILELRTQVEGLLSIIENLIEKQ